MKITCLLLPLLLLTYILNGQSIKPDVLASSGGNGTNSEISLCWTLGETVINELSDNEFILSQGFHQGSLTVISGSENIPENCQIIAYPNPTSNSLKIEIANIQTSDTWIIEVFNSDGKMILHQIANPNVCEIDFSSYPAAEYLVRIRNNQNLMKTFNIVKK
jgi:hypothetical protein